MAKGKRPQPSRSVAPLPVHAPPEPLDSELVSFCFHHTVKGYSVDELDRGQQADLAQTLQQRCRMTWLAITQAGRHGQGTEKLPPSSIKPKVPTRFQDTDKFTVFRYSGKLPMVGVRIGGVFHVLWIERRFGDVYCHGH